MKKILTMVLAFALLLTSAAAFAESHPTPPVSTFAQLTVKTSDTAYTFAFTKPVDRLFVNWTEGIQEYLVDENLRAYAFRAGHKFLAGITEHYSNAKSVLVYNGKTLLWEDIQIDPVTGKEVIQETKTYSRIETVKGTDNMEHKLRDFIKKYGSKYEIEYDEPQQVFETVVDEEGNTVEVPKLDKDGNPVYIDGEIRAYTMKTKYFATNVATPDQIAFITLQDEWIVCYNRSGKIVSIEYFDGDEFED